MGAFIASHMLEIVLGLVSAGALALCKYFHKQFKNYKSMLDEKEHEEIEATIDNKIEPIIEEIEELRTYIRNVDSLEQHRINLIVSSYRFRLIQLCKQYLKQNYLTQSQYDQLSEFYKLYKELGGNGQAEGYYKKTVALDIKPD